MSSNTLNGSIRESLELFVGHLLRWNATYRLVGESSSQGIWEKHIIDAMVAAPFLQSATSVVDLGCGPGLPGILLKILCPWCQVVLIDSQRKRINFCEFVVRALNLSGVQVICGRAEDQSVIDHAGNSHEVVLTRATWRIRDFIVMGTPYTTRNGTFLAFKGQDWQSEVDDGVFKSHNARVDFVVPYSLLTGRSQRSLVVLRRW